LRVNQRQVFRQVLLDLQIRDEEERALAVCALENACLYDAKVRAYVQRYLARNPLTIAPGAVVSPRARKSISRGGWRLDGQAFGIDSVLAAVDFMSEFYDTSDVSSLVLPQSRLGWVTRLKQSAQSARDTFMAAGASLG